MNLKGTYCDRQSSSNGWLFQNIDLICILSLENESEDCRDARTGFFTAPETINRKVSVLEAEIM